jgi:conjugative transfer signal peptidase TraF
MSRRRFPPWVAGTITLPKRARRRPAIRLMAATALAAAAIGVPASLHPVPRLIWNASASVPLGLYWVTHATVAPGDLALAELPPAVRQVAAERGYLPLGVLLVKRVAAQAGDLVCRRGSLVSINHHAVARALSFDAKGRALPGWRGCRQLATDEVFLLVPTVPASFDGRYFGPIRRRAVIGKLVPLWTW